MRISTTMMMRNFSQTLDNKLGDIDKYSNQVSSSRKFERASEDPVSAMQTIEACHEYAENQQYVSSDNSAASWLQATETTTNQINDILKSAQEKATEALNGTNNDGDRQNLAKAMESYRDEIVQTLNSSFSGRYIFGKDTEGKPPFKLGTADEDGAANDGKLMYYNYNATDASGNPAPKYVSIDSLSQSDLESMRLSMPVDLNMGLQINGGKIKQSSIFEASTSGLDVIVSGYDSTSGKATNIVDQLTDAVKNLNTNNMSGLSSILSNVESAQNTVLKTNVEIGEKEKMLSFLSSKLTDDETNINSRLADSLEVDSTQAIMQYNISQIVYKESLSISSTVLQQSLIDFLK